MKRTSRIPRQLSDSLHHRLNAYALAAGAAGVSLLALAGPAQARIVYTPGHVTFGGSPPQFKFGWQLLSRSQSRRDSRFCVLLE